MTDRSHRLASTATTHLLAVIVSAVCAAPVLVVLIASLKSLSTFDNLSPFTGGWTLANYAELLTGGQLPRWVLNSLLVGVVVTALTVVIDLMAGFAFAKLRFRGREPLFLLLISTMMLPFSITLVPTYLLVARYGLVDTFPGLILPALSGPLGVYLMRQFIKGIPDALLEAATIDGASLPRIFLQIVVPLCRQPMAVLTVFTFVGTWNSFLWPLLIAQSDSMKTLTVGIATANLQFERNLGTITAQAIISLVPMLILFVAFQRFFVKGITAGAFKG
ncbi:binding-protein-dependent transport systems inner membrane component [Kribbella flavida DSM 17836]|uniref:Binding-protein-dependent transport systems inner membrane component n=1 Tax=Kribbella flavida (strain DSM 17836 / JCM 10339 / NBRC 14399) TaxID=479435 RepID=D2PWR9_KRIFD|nr:carbohydrate ABC transporter permease [Kribbella flavida]ADB33538.1 binding-protein-dependent transport systems inner membrane component [Kribbella flavida DSM 17836]